MPGGFKLDEDVEEELQAEGADEEEEQDEVAGGGTEDASTPRMIGEEIVVPAGQLSRLHLAAQRASVQPMETLRRESCLE